MDLGSLEGLEISSNGGQIEEDQLSAWFPSTSLDLDELYRDCQGSIPSNAAFLSAGATSENCWGWWKEELSLLATPRPHFSFFLLSKWFSINFWKSFFFFFSIAEIIYRSWCGYLHRLERWQKREVKKRKKPSNPPTPVRSSLQPELCHQTEIPRNESNSMSGYGCIYCWYHFFFIRRRCFRNFSTNITKKKKKILN